MPSSTETRNTAKTVKPSKSTRHLHRDICRESFPKRNVSAAAQDLGGGLEGNSVSRTSASSTLRELVPLRLRALVRGNISPVTIVVVHAKSRPVSVAAGFASLVHWCRNLRAKRLQSLPGSHPTALVFTALQHRNAVWRRLYGLLRISSSSLCSCRHRV